LIVPSVIDTIPTATQEMVNAALSRFRDFHGDMLKANAFDKRPGGGGGVPPAAPPKR
jgi:hypothetical protein